MPIKFTFFPWQDLPNQSTPFDKESARELEERLVKFTEEFENHFTGPVKKESELPTELAKPAPVLGDIKYVEELNQLFAYHGGSEWKPLAVTVPHWKAPVAKEANLPTASNEVGDIRLVREPTFVLYVCKATVGTIEEQWEPLPPRGKVEIITPLTWAIAEKVEAKPEKIPGPFFRVATNETLLLRVLEGKLEKGKVVLKLLKNNTAVKFEGGSTEFELTTAATAFKLEKDETLTNEDRLRLEVISISGTPEGLALSAFIKHTSKVI